MKPARIRAYERKYLAPETLPILYACTSIDVLSLRAWRTSSVIISGLFGLEVPVEDVSLNFFSAACLNRFQFVADRPLILRLALCCSQRNRGVSRP